LDEYDDDDLDSVDEEDLLAAESDEGGHLQHDLEANCFIQRPSFGSDSGTPGHGNNNTEGGGGGRETIMEVGCNELRCFDRFDLLHITYTQRSTAIVESVRSVFVGAVDATNSAVDKVVEVSAGLAVGVASKTPGLKSIVKQHVHR
jgi:hypothetical protein